MTTTPENHNPTPLIMRLARVVAIPPNCPATYNPQSQMCDGFETIVTMGSKDRSTCNRSSSTGEGLLDVFTKSDSDRKRDD